MRFRAALTPSGVFEHSGRYAMFFPAFGIVSLFWMRFHRIMSCGFAPGHSDVGLLFAFLAFVALTPYALVTYTRLQSVDPYSPESIMLYLCVFLGVITFSWVLTLRGMRRAWPDMDALERRRTWRAFVASGVAIPIFGAAIAIVDVYGTRGFSALLAAAVAVPVALHVFARPWRWLVGADPAPA